ncbi:T cell receptor alpha chain MC.7.G5-like isoform X1 [Nerophis ophidion]|uniref:T cell receptor alpha chain MC.7.G5-like isoform X1 n=1 Tax=Nerophis ophidion TaxID=159077 RepID=UPI002AE0AF9E|nr:T cell receptor alpha chain MC.7.G5-like isoform X1 [Nerophis ophidion]
MAWREAALEWGGKQKLAGGSFIMSLSACWLLLLSLTGVVRGGELTARMGEVFALEGGQVTLSYPNISDVSSATYFFWYKHLPGRAPHFLMSHSGGKIVTEGSFSVSVEKEQRRVNVLLENADISHSAVYYCAVKTSVASKLHFGSGTRLIVEVQEDLAPSFYKMEGNVTACLATGFSRHNAMEKAGKKEVFEGSHAVRISGESLYNQVALVSAEKADLCEKGDIGPGHCQVDWSSDEKVNLVSLTVLVLRLVFAKTLAINGAMTLQLWFVAP